MAMICTSKMHLTPPVALAVVSSKTVVLYFVESLVIVIPIIGFCNCSIFCCTLLCVYSSFCLVFAMPLCASFYMCLVVTCWESADLLALVCGV